MKGAFYVFAIVALLIGVQAYEGIEPVSEPTPEAVYSALFSFHNIGHRLKHFNPHFIRDAGACVETFLEQDVQLLEIFGEGVRECLNITVEQFQSLFNSGVYEQIAAEIKTQFVQCKADSKGFDERVDCYTNAIVQYVNGVGQVSFPYFRISFSCLKTQVRQLESQWHTIYRQMISCFDHLRN